MIMHTNYQVKKIQTKKIIFVNTKDHIRLVDLVLKKTM